MAREAIFGHMFANLLGIGAKRRVSEFKDCDRGLTLALVPKWD